MKLALAESKLEKAQQALESGSTPFKQKQLTAARTAVEKATGELNRLSPPPAPPAPPAPVPVAPVSKALTDARMKLALAQSKLEKAQQALESGTTPFKQKQLTAARTAVEKATGELNRLTPSA